MNGVEGWPTAENPVPGLASILEYGVVEVNESVGEAGVCTASTLALTSVGTFSSFEFEIRSILCIRRYWLVFHMHRRGVGSSPVLQ